MITVKRPTILIGVGGTGGVIADRVLAKAQSAGLREDSRVIVVGIDTHLRDLRELKHIERRFRIQTSDQRSVRELLLEPSWSSIKTWHLPMESFNEDTLSKTLLSGAGQIRMLSRLATYLTFKDGNARQVLLEAISRVTRLRTRDTNAPEVQVVIASSLAGATGSGSFIQIASAMDQLCKEAGVSGLVRGVFLMGDVFVRTSTLPIEQLVNAQFNTYAALAELNACNAFASGRNAPVGFTFEVAPEMQIKVGVPPLQTVTLIDYENDIGGNLGVDREAYNEMAVRAVYQYVFTPIGERLDGVMINDQRAKQRAEEAGRRPLYSGIGVHAIRYPREDVESYVASAYAAENLRGEWLALDDLYDLAYRDYELRRQTDPSAVRPDVGELFLRNFELLRGESSFIKLLHATLHPGGVDLDGNLAKPAHRRYLEALEAEILRQYWELPPLPTLVKGITRVTTTQLEDADDISGMVVNMETALDRAWRAVSVTAPTQPTDIFRTVFSTGLEPERLGGYRDHHLKRWLVADKLHLVAIRWFLYALRNDVRAARATLRADDIQRAILNLGNQFNPPPERGSSPSPAPDGGQRARSNPEILERARQAQRRGWFSKRKAFAAQVTKYYQNSILSIEKWAVTKAREQIYDNLLRELDAMIALVELAFDRVKDLKRGLDRDLSEMAGAHSAARGRGLFDGIRYVLSEPSDKERIAATAIQNATRTVEEGAETNAAIGQLVLSTYLDARKANPMNPREPIARLDIRQVDHMLRERLVDRDARAAVQGRLRPYYDFSVWGAVQRDWLARREEAGIEAQSGGGVGYAVPDSPEKYLELLVQEVRGHAQPFIDYTTAGVGQSIIFWSINPAVVEEFEERERLLDILKSGDGENIDENEAHLRTELLCTHVRANLDLSDLRKLHPGDGSEHARGASTGAYRKAYLEEVAPLRRPGGASGGRITPHIDRNWHKAGILPELFPQSQKQLSDEIDRAIVLAMVLGILLKTTPAGRGPVTAIDLSRLPGGVGSLREVATSHDDWTIVSALRRNSDYTLAAEILWDEQLKSLQAADAALTRPAGLAAQARTILAMAVPVKDREQRAAAVESLLLRLLEILAQVVARLMPQQTSFAQAAYVLQIAREAFPAAAQELAAEEGLESARAKDLDVICDRVLLSFERTT
ncbi:tubulin-like doman-containing protein [Methylorubrum sp. SB2]|uniref:tubulin-like doman-containing protein n=1 Tax=Methylorubrum subtropicum TaxID=3138812 RepID=UPI00313E18BC